MEWMEVKWLAIGVIGFAACVASSMSVDSYSKSLEAKAAMENGYEQVREGHVTLWKKGREAQSVEAESTGG